VDSGGEIGTLVVQRDTARWAWILSGLVWLAKVRVAVDGVRVATLRRGERASVEVAAGVHTVVLSVGRAHSNPHVITVGAGDTCVVVGGPSSRAMVSHLSSRHDWTTAGGLVSVWNLGDPAPVKPHVRRWVRAVEVLRGIALALVALRLIDAFDERSLVGLLLLGPLAVALWFAEVFVPEQ
jgi:hypothetical protein